jgi:CBS domain-containing protein
MLPAGSLDVQDAMTPVPAVLHATHSVRAALRMFSNKPFHHLPVMLGKKLVGVISDRDLSSFIAKRPRALDSEVAAVMTPDPKTVLPQASLAHAARLFVDHRIHCLPVVNEAGILLGIVTPTDLLRAFIRLLPA